jgi:hypothetical protein
VTSFPSAAGLLSAWEAAAAHPHVNRAPALLEALGAIGAGDELTVGQCDHALFAWRRELFGERLELEATCPRCATDVELTLFAGELQRPPLEGPATFTVEHGGRRIAGRLPSNADLRALADLPSDERLRALLARCMTGGDALDGDAALAVLEAMADHDPGAHLALAVRCSCGAEWVDELDIRSIVWADVSGWVGRTLTEVHQLATSYGWSEAEVLATPAWRRRWYAEAAGW